MVKIKQAILIEDDSITNFLHYRLIKKLNISENITLYDSGTSALNYLKEISQKKGLCPELILLDLKMPVLDGFEFLKAFKKISFENEKRVVVIIVSDSFNPHDFESLNSMGFRNHLSKPLTEGKLKELLLTIPTIL
jgi:CheY-like chemotaxis protein